MLFISPTFLFVFLPACVAAYFAARGMRARNAVLLGASWLFYAWDEPLYVGLMLAVTIFNYAAALGIDQRQGAARKTGLVLTVGISPPWRPSNTRGFWRFPPTRCCHL